MTASTRSLLYHKPPRKPAYVSWYVSLSTKEFAWIYSDVWETAQLEYFFQQRETSSPNLSKTYHSYPHRESRKDRSCEGKSERFLYGPSAWVLSVSKNRSTERRDWSLEAWAEVSRLSSGTFIKHLLSFSWPKLDLAKEDGRGTDRRDSRLSLLISGLFISTDSDVLVICPSCPQDELLFQSLQCGELRDIHLVMDPASISSPDRQSFSSKRVFYLWKDHWWKSVCGQKDKETLQYLSLAQKRRKKTCSCCK